MRQFYLKFLLAAVCSSGLFTPAKADEYSWHGYYDGKETLSEFGTGISESYDCAVYLPGDHGAASGKAIHKISFVVQATDCIENLKVWVSTLLPKNTDDANVAVIPLQTEGLADGQPVEVSLVSPYWMPSEGAYIGFSFDSSDPFPLLTTPSSTTENGGFFLKTSVSYPEWKDFSKYNNGNLPIQVLIDGKIYGNAARVADMPEVSALAGETAVLPVSIVNNGINGITSVTYSLQSDDNEPEIFDYEFPAPIKEILHTGEIPIKFQGDDKAGISYKHFSILKVNGEDNETSDETTGHGAVITIEEGAPRTTVMEEFTGTWCGWCPRGAVGMEALKEDFKTDFIGIAIHKKDPMEIAEYADILENVSSFPGCHLNRAISGDPFFGSATGPGHETSYGIRLDFENEQRKLVNAIAGVESEWTDKDGGLLKVAAYAGLMYDRKDCPDFTVAYVVTADSLSGEGAGWVQNNDFSLTMAQGYKDDPYIGWLTSQPQLMRDVIFMDVAIAAVGINNGIPVTSEGGWKAGELRECGTQEFDLAYNELFQNPDNIKVCVLLIDHHSGEIINAAQGKVGEKKTSGVNDKPVVSASETTVISIYNMSGQKLKELTPGINLVRHSDGSVKKIFVKP